MTVFTVSYRRDSSSRPPEQSAWAVPAKDCRDLQYLARQWMRTAPTWHIRSLKSGSIRKSPGFSSLSLKMRVLCSYNRWYSASASAYRGLSWHRDTSMNLRRAAAPSRMRNKSSGQKNTVCITSESSALFLAVTPLTVIFRRRPACRVISVTNSRPREKISPRSVACCLSKEISSLSDRVRGDLPQERYTMASSRLVLPCAFSPWITLQTLSNSRVCSR